MIANLCFRPNDVPRKSEMVLVGEPPKELTFPEFEDRLQYGPPYAEDVVVAHAGPNGLATKDVEGLIVPVAYSVDWLTSVALDCGDEQVEFWSVVAKVGLELVARGRVQPSASDDELDIWEVGPLEPEDLEILHRLEAAMPVGCNAIPTSTEPIRVLAPGALIRSYWNAIADTIARTPAAVRTVRSPAYASPDTFPVGNLRNWIDDGAFEAESIKFGLRLEAPGDRGKFSVVPYMRSTADQSLSIDAEHFWKADEAVLHRLGDGAEEVLLRSLRRAAHIWSPFSRIMDKARPDRLELGENEVDEFLEGATENLRANGFEISWPSEFLSSHLELRAKVSSKAPGGGVVSGFGLGDALELRWEVALGTGDDVEMITDEELRQLAEAKRPLVQLRGKWVVVDHTTLDKIRRKKAKKTQSLGAGEALAAAIGGVVTIDGERIEVDVDSRLSELALRLTDHHGERTLDEPEGLQATLRPYQRRGLAWLNEMCELGLGGCLADDMGLGKTIQVVALHLYRKSRGIAGPMLVVCPTSLLGNWQREFAKFAPEINVRRFHGAERNLDDIGDTDVTLVTYGVARRDRQLLAQKHWDLVIADEAQHIKNPMSQTARSLRGMTSNVRLALTGTPVENQLSELWSLLDWTTPGLLGPLETFRRNVALPIERFQDEEITATLSAVVRPFLLRRRKVDPEIAPELPQKTETDVFVPLTVEQASLYKAITDEALDTISKKKGIERRGLVLKLLTSLKQICNHPAQFLKQPAPLEKRSGKLAAFDEIIEGLEGTDESVLVFSQYVQMCRLLEGHLISRGQRPLFLHGSITANQRDEMVEQFQAGESKIFLLSLKAGGTGLNLTRATHVIHYDRWWNPAVEDQATDRAYRIGQTQPVQVHRMISEGTLEERIAKLLDEKRKLSESVIGTGETWISELSDNELASLVSFEGVS